MPANRVDLNHGRHFLSIPGPSVIPDRVLAAMSRPMPNIYEGDLVDMSNGILEEIKGVARTSGHGFIAIANGHGAWEMALTNTLSKGRYGSGARVGPVRRRLGRAGKDAGRPCSEHRGRPAGCGRSGSGRSGAPPRRRPRDQGGTGGSGRHGHLGLERHCRHPRGDGRGGSPGASDGRHHRVDGMHAVRDGSMGRRRDRRRRPEGSDGATRARFRMGLRQGARGSQIRRTAHGLLGLERADGRWRGITCAIAGRHRSAICSRCAKRST